MNAPGQATDRQVRRLLRWYPTSWRRRYGEEFAELLTAEVDENPRLWRRTIDVAWSGSRARCAAAGLTTSSRRDPAAPSAGLASFGCAWALFVVLALSVWAQLTIGWQWAAPRSAGTATAVIVMSGVMALFLVLTVLAGAPVVWVAFVRIVRRQSPAMERSSLVFLGGLAVLVIGSRHFGNGWPGTGGHAPPVSSGTGGA